MPNRTPSSPTGNIQTLPVWENRIALCKEAINSLDVLGKKSRPQKAAIAFLEKFVEVTTEYVFNKSPDSGNKQHSITELSLEAGCEKINLKTVSQPTVVGELFPDKRLDVLVLPPDTDNRHVAIECKSSTGFNDVAAAMVEFRVARKGSFFDWRDRDPNRNLKISPQATHFILICMAGDDQKWFKSLAKDFFKGDSSKKPTYVGILEHSKDTSAEQLTATVVELFRKMLEHLVPSTK